MRMFPLTLLFVLALSVLLGNPLGRAQRIQSVAPSCREEPECARLLDQGQEYSKAEQFVEAERAYERAYQRRPDPLLLYNIARVLHKAGRASLAIPYYQKYLDAGSIGDEAQRRKAQEYLQEARQQTPEPPLSPAPSAPRGPALLIAPLRPQSASHHTPLYRRWWLWTAVGATLAGIAVGVGLGIAARRPNVTDTAAIHPFGN
jgi:tetratricopeptide (TPR) repeat protein